jgi:hypothetical protein
MAKALLRGGIAAKEIKHQTSKIKKQNSGIAAQRQ